MAFMGNSHYFRNICVSVGFLCRVLGSTGTDPDTLGQNKGLYAEDGRAQNPLPSFERVHPKHTPRTMDSVTLTALIVSASLGRFNHTQVN